MHKSDLLLKTAIAGSAAAIRFSLFYRPSLLRALSVIFRKQAVRAAEMIASGRGYFPGSVLTKREKLPLVAVFYCPLLPRLA